MAIYLSEDDVRQVLTMPMALAAVERAHRAHGTGAAIDVPRARTRLPAATLHLLQGALPEMGVIGYKAYTSSRAGIRFLVHLYDAADGALQAIVSGDLLGMMRTGAAGGVAAKVLARTDAQVAGVFGAGWQARGQIEALAAVRPLRQIKVHARRRERLEVFCTEMSDRLGVPVRPAESARATVEGSDIVTTITTSATPVFEGEWLAPGTHVNAAGSNALNRRELDETAVRRAGLVCVDARASAVREAGDLLPLLEKGRLHEGQLVELGEILAGARPGRCAAEQITLFESQGLAIQDLSLAADIVEAARRQGLGQTLPL